MVVDGLPQDEQCLLQQWPLSTRSCAQVPHSTTTLICLHCNSVFSNLCVKLPTAIAAPAPMRVFSFVERLFIHRMMATRGSFTFPRVSSDPIVYAMSRLRSRPDSMCVLSVGVYQISTMCHSAHCRTTPSPADNPYYTFKSCVLCRCDDNIQLRGSGGQLMAKPQTLTEA